MDLVHDHMSTAEVLVEFNESDCKESKYLQSKCMKRSDFQDWVKPIKNDPKRAFCIVCKAKVKSDVTSLKSHAKGKRHLQAMVAYYCDSEKDTLFNQDCMLPTSYRKRSFDLVDSSSETKFQKIILQCPDNNEEGDFSVTKISEEIEVSTPKSCDAVGKERTHRRQKYRKEWEQHEAYGSWLRPVVGDCYKAYCLACQVALKSELVCIKGHTKGIKHQKALETFSGEEATLTEHPHLQEFLLDSQDYQETLKQESGNEHPGCSADDELMELLQQIPNSSSRFSPDERLASCNEEEIIQKLLEIVSSNFCADLASLLRRNSSVIRTLRKNPDFISGHSGGCRITRLMVGRLAQEYITDYSLNTSDTGVSDSSINDLKDRLNCVEEILENSASQVQKLRSMGPLDSKSDPIYNSDFHISNES